MLWGGWMAQACGSGLLCFTAVFFPLVPQALSMLLQAKVHVHSPAARSRALTKRRDSLVQDQDAACSLPCPWHPQKMLQGCSSGAG